MKNATSLLISAILITLSFSASAFDIKGNSPDQIANNRILDVIDASKALDSNDLKEQGRRIQAQLKISEDETINVQDSKAKEALTEANQSLKEVITALSLGADGIPANYLQILITSLKSQL